MWPRLAWVLWYLAAMLAAHDMFPRTARLNCNSGRYPVILYRVDWYSQFESPRRCVFPFSFSAGICHLPSTVYHTDRSGLFGDLARYSSTVACCLLPGACRLSSVGWKRQMGVCIPRVRAGLVAPYVPQNVTGLHTPAASGLEKRRMGGRSSDEQAASSELRERLGLDLRITNGNGND